MAPAGTVVNHEATILPITLKSRSLTDIAKPTPKTAPTNVCVVEMGMALPDAITTVVAAASSAAKPLVGVSLVISFPIV